MAIPSFTMDQGEGRRIAAVDTTLASTPPYDDLTGGVVTMRLKSWAPGAATIPPIAGTLDAPGADGKIRGAGAYVPRTLPAGAYDGELEVDRPDGGEDWPQRWPFTLTVRARGV